MIILHNSEVVNVYFTLIWTLITDRDLKYVTKQSHQKKKKKKKKKTEFFYA